MAIRGWYGIMWLASGRQHQAEDGWTCARIMGVPPPPVVGVVPG